MPPDEIVQTQEIDWAQAGKSTAQKESSHPIAPTSPANVYGMTMERIARTEGREAIITDALVLAGASHNRDLQESALYAMDILMPTHPGLVANVLYRLIEEPSLNERGLETVSLYLTGSNYFNPELERVYKVFLEVMERYRAEHPPSPYTVQPSEQSSTINSDELLVIVHGTWAHGVPILRHLGWAAANTLAIVRFGLHYLNPLARNEANIRWPTKSNWYAWPEPFPTYLDELTGGAVYKPVKHGDPPPFYWSGSNDHEERLRGAALLKAWVDIVLPEDDKRKLTVIAHSHGGNVALSAAAGLGLKIHHLVLLGTPIRTEYPVNLSNIKRISNIYSLGDWVQQMGGIPNSRGEARTLSDTSDISNVLTGGFPSHTELHDKEAWKSNNLASMVF